MPDLGLGKIYRIVLVFNTCRKAYRTEDENQAKCSCQNSVKSFIQRSLDKKHNQKTPSSAQMKLCGNISMFS